MTASLQSFGPDHRFPPSAGPGLLTARRDCLATSLPVGLPGVAGCKPLPSPVFSRVDGFGWLDLLAVACPISRPVPGCL
jgi:hypothetical protein